MDTAHRLFTMALVNLPPVRSRLGTEPSRPGATATRRPRKSDKRTTAALETVERLVSSDDAQQAPVALQPSFLEGLPIKQAPGDVLGRLSVTTTSRVAVSRDVSSLDWNGPFHLKPPISDASLRLNWPKQAGLQPRPKQTTWPLLPSPAPGAQATSSERLELRASRARPSGRRLPSGAGRATCELSELQKWHQSDYQGPPPRRPPLIAMMQRLHSPP